MINLIIEAVGIALNGEFGEDYEIHKEETTVQEPEKPYFLIACLSSEKELFPGKRYFRKNQFCIRYFPAGREKQRECNDVAERMYDCLEYVTPDGGGSPVPGTKMKHEAVGGVLKFFVNYDCFTYRTEEQTAMDELKSNTAVKGGE